MSANNNLPEPPEGATGRELDMWRELMNRLYGGSRGVESLAQFSEGDVVDTPDGLGVVSDVRTEPFTGKNDDEIEASSDSPTYVVALESVDPGVGFYSASDLSASEFPDTGIDDPTEALAVQHIDTDTEALLETTFGIPDSWEESPKPNRLILLDAWSSMGGTFRGARKELGSARLAASMKDRVLQWEGWRS